MKKYFGLFIVFIFFLQACNQEESTPKYEIIFQETDGNQYLADVYLPEFSSENGDRVLTTFIFLIEQKYGDEISGIHISFWNKRFTEKEMISYNLDDKFKPPSGTKTFLANYGYAKDFREVQSIYKF